MNETEMQWPEKLMSLFPAAREVVVDANTRYLIEDHNSIWLVKESQGDLFVVEKENPQFIPLFIQAVRTGDLIFPASGDAFNYVFFFISPRPTTLLQLPLEPFLKLLSTDSVVKHWMVEQIEKWVDNIFQLFETEKTEQGITEIPRAPTIELQPDVKVRIKVEVAIQLKKKLTWMKCTQGDIQIETEELWRLYQGQECFLPLHPHWFLEATTPARLVLETTDEIVNDYALFKGLFLFHQWLFAYFEIEQQHELEKFAKMSQQREENAKKLLDDSLHRLGSVFKKEEFYPLFSVDPLTGAMHQIANRLKVKIAEVKGKHATVDEQLEDLCNRSNLFYRQIKLKDNWWQCISQPTLAFYGKERQPVALLPHSDTQCVFFDPSSAQTVKVDETNAQQFGEKAFSFYVPLSQKKTTFLSLVHFTFSFCKKESVWLLALAIGLAILNLFLPFAMQQLFDVLSDSANFTVLKQLTTGLVLVAFSIWVFNVSKNFTLQRLRSLSLVRLQLGVWGRILTLPISFFRQYTSGETMNRYLSTMGIHQAIVTSGTSALFALAYMFFYFLQMFLFNPMLALYMSGAFLIVAVINLWCIIKQTTLLAAITRCAAKTEGFILQTIMGLSKIRVASAENRFFNLWSEKFVDKKKMELRFQRYQAFVGWITIVFPPLTTLLIYMFGLTIIQEQKPGVAGALTTGKFVGFAVSFSLFTSNALSVLQTVFVMMKMKPMWDNFKPLVTTPPEEIEGKESLSQITGKVVLDHISFRYEEEGPWILDDVSIVADPGEMIGIVGPSGSGKSTIVRQLLGFETPNLGSVYYDDKDLADLDTRSIRSRIGTVLQKGDLMAGSIYENIVGSGKYSLDEIKKAIYYAGFEADLKLMPMGLHTVIPMGGESFSGGQKQRLLLARALVALPKILILDEATSALDNINQNLVSTNLDQLKMTRIVIAHRLSTIKNADRIYVLVKGKIIQAGSYQELAEQPGIFASMLHRQRL